jgi:hypothetical protein
MTLRVTLLNLQLLVGIQSCFPGFHLVDPQHQTTHLSCGLAKQIAACGLVDGSGRHEISPLQLEFAGARTTKWLQFSGQRLVEIGVPMDTWLVFFVSEIIIHSFLGSHRFIHFMLHEKITILFQGHAQRSQDTRKTLAARQRLDCRR